MKVIVTTAFPLPLGAPKRVCLQLLEHARVKFLWSLRPFLHFCLQHLAVRADDKPESPFTLTRFSPLGKPEAAPEPGDLLLKETTHFLLLKTLGYNQVPDLQIPDTGTPAARPVGPDTSLHARSTGSSADSSPFVSGEGALGALYDLTRYELNWPSRKEERPEDFPTARFDTPSGSEGAAVLSQDGPHRHARGCPRPKTRCGPSGDCSLARGSVISFILLSLGLSRL